MNESPLRDRTATVGITGGMDIVRFRIAGYSVDGPIPDLTPAIFSVRGRPHRRITGTLRRNLGALCTESDGRLLNP